MLCEKAFGSLTEKRCSVRGPYGMKPISLGRNENKHKLVGMVLILTQIKFNYNEFSLLVIMRKSVMKNG